MSTSSEAKMGGREERETFLFFFPIPTPTAASNTQGRPDTQDIVTLSSDEWLRFVYVKRAKKVGEVELIRSPVLNRSLF